MKRRLVDRTAKYRPHGVRWGTVAGLLLLTCLILVLQAHAGSGSTVSLPLAGRKVTTGVNLLVHTQWLDGTGYRPVTISISPLGGGAAPADRTFDVTLRPHSYQWGVVLPRVSTSITLEQGQTVANKTIAVPQFQSWGSIEIDTFEEGRRRDDLCENVGVSWTGGISDWTEAAPAILIIDSDVPPGLRGSLGTVLRTPNTGQQPKRPERIPDFRQLASLFPGYHSNNNIAIAGIQPTEDIDDNGLLRVAQMLGRFDIIHPERLPTEWLQLSSVDLIFLSMSELAKLQASPATWEALRAWLATGPTLCVYDVGGKFQRLAELEQLLDISVATSGPDSELDFAARGWAAPQAADYVSEVRAQRNAEWNSEQYLIQQAAIGASNVDTAAQATSKPDSSRPFLIRDVECGHLVAFASPNPFPGKREDWCWLFNSLSGQDWMWYQRHGMSFHRENPQYWNLLIPGVGDAPVLSFLVLISLFVIVIGPVNYFMLYRRHQLYLLLLTVPLGAGVVTATLFLYALVNDGLGVRARARSLTRLDQTSGRIVSWSRQSYYAGLAPSAGMSFPTDAAVYPIDHRPTGRYGQPKDLGRRIRWVDQQRLAQGYLNSRSTAQMLVIESRSTDLGIEVADGATGLQVTNGMGVDIEHLVLKTAGGDILNCEGVSAGESAELQQATNKEFWGQWGKLFAAQRPQFPIGFDPNQVENAAAIFGNSYAWWQQVDRGLPAPSTTTSILERGLRDIGNMSPPLMPRRTYLAIVRQAPNVSLGVKAVAEEASFHVVAGKY